MGLRPSRKSFNANVSLLRRDLLGITGIAIAATFLGIAFAVTVFGTRLLPYDPIAIDLANICRPPTWAHLFGTDELGRDVLSRIIMATPLDAEIGLTIVGGGLLIGLLVGSVAGFFGGRIDNLLMRTTDLFLAFPTMVLAIAVAVALGPGVLHVIEAYTVTWWSFYARLARTSALSLKESQYVEAAQIAGLSKLSIILKHIIPNAISPLLVFATLDLGNAIIYASVLSYLGLGAQPPQSEWGMMVFDGQQYLASAWWISVIPGLAIFCVALGFNLLGDSLRDILDPRYRR